MVSREDAIDALVARDNDECDDAAHFWLGMPLGFYLVFDKKVCELLDE
jgi:hypothetical protein